MQRGLCLIRLGIYSNGVLSLVRSPSFRGHSAGPGQDCELHEVCSSLKCLSTRRSLIAAWRSAVLATGAIGHVAARTCQLSLAPTPSMRGGSNNYRPGAPIVDRIGGGGFWMTGTVRRAGRRRPPARPAHPDLGAYDRRA